MQCCHQIWMRHQIAHNQIERASSLHGDQRKHPGQTKWGAHRQVSGRRHWRCKHYSPCNYATSRLVSYWLLFAWCTADWSQQCWGRILTFVKMKSVIIYISSMSIILVHNVHQPGLCVGTLCSLQSPSHKHCGTSALVNMPVKMLVGVCMSSQCPAVDAWEHCNRCLMWVLDCGYPSSLAMQIPNAF